MAHAMEKLTNFAVAIKLYLFTPRFVQFIHFCARKTMQNFEAHFAHSMDMSRLFSERPIIWFFKKKVTSDCFSTTKLRLPRYSKYSYGWALRILSFELINSLTMNLFSSTSDLAGALLYVFYLTKLSFAALTMERASFLLSDCLRVFFTTKRCGRRAWELLVV